MKTINPSSRNDKALLRRIGGRVVETCFTCVFEFNSSCCTTHEFQFVRSTTHRIFVCNDYKPIPDSEMSAVTDKLTGPRGVPRCKTPHLADIPSARKIYAGCYVDTAQFGEAVCIENIGNWIRIRYEAVRCADMKKLWVENSVIASNCTYLRKADKASRAVLKLKGPYGED